jgi:cyanophycinase
MSGPLALVGSGEFTAAMDEVDAALLRAVGAARPRVAVVPTASFPDGDATFRRWIDLGVAHFSGLGAEPVPVPIGERDDAFDVEHVRRLAEADLVYLSGGKPGYLLRVLRETPAWEAVLSVRARGGAVAGCSAGAMVMAGCLLAPRRGKIPFPPRWDPALGLVEGVSVIPHYDQFPEPLAALVAFGAPPEVLVLGIDEDTALVGRDGAWQVQGRGRVTVWRGRERRRHRAGEVIAL